MVNIFQNRKWKQEYAIEINNKIEYWKILMMKIVWTIILMKKQENVKTIIKETKQQLIEKDEGTETFQNKRYEEECKFATEEIKKAREQQLIKGRREKEEQEYHLKRKEAHKIITNKKKTYMKNVIESIEDQKHNNTRKCIKQ